MTEQRTAGSYFRSLYNAEQAENAYHRLANEMSTQACQYPESSPMRAIAERETDRLRELSEEMAADADDCRDEILSAGYTPEQYLAWVDAQEAAR